MTSPDGRGGIPGSRHSLTLLAGILREWRLVVAMTVLTALAALVVNALRQPPFAARTILFDDVSEPAFPNFPGQFPRSGIYPGTSSSNDRLVRLIARSRSLADTVAARAGMRHDVDAYARSDGSLVITVWHRDPVQAARIANMYPDVINLFVARIGAETAARKQLYLQDQLGDARRRLEAVEERVVAFQTARGAPEIRDQLSATIERALLLEEQIAEQEVQLSLLRRTSAPDNPSLRAAEAALEARREQRRRLQSERSGSLLPSLGESPELQIEASRFLRSLTEAEQYYSAIATALSSTQVTAGENLPAVAVLDAAVPPRRPVGPGPGVVTLAGLLFGMLLGCIVVTVRVASAQARRNEQFAPVFEDWDDFKLDVTSSLAGLYQRKRPIGAPQANDPATATGQTSRFPGEAAT